MSLHLSRSKPKPIGHSVLKLLDTILTKKSKDITDEDVESALEATQKVSHRFFKCTPDKYKPLIDDAYLHRSSFINNVGSIKLMRRGLNIINHDPTLKKYHDVYREKYGDK